MKLAISNIAWNDNEEVEIAKVLQQLKIKYVEIALTKKWQEPTKELDDEKITDYIQFWKSFDIDVVAFQSMLYNRPDLKIFENASNRYDTLMYLSDFIKLANKFHASVMVFGSPKNRLKNGLEDKLVNNIAVEFFNKLAIEVNKYGIKICIEPNAKEYGCDFITNAKEGLDLVKKVNQPGFRLHLDTGCMSLAGDDFTESITKSANWLGHFHISSPMLNELSEDQKANHIVAAKALRKINYEGYVSIEMRPNSEGQNIKRVQSAIEFVRNNYQI